jgi:hypothetical protein
MNLFLVQNSLFESQAAQHRTIDTRTLAGFKRCQYFWEKTRSIWVFFEGKCFEQGQGANMLTTFKFLEYAHIRRSVLCECSFHNQ